MKASKEVRNWVTRVRRRFGGKNGVAPSYAFDNPEMIRKAATSWKRRSLSKPLSSQPQKGE